LRLSLFYRRHDQIAFVAAGAQKKNSGAGDRNETGDGHV
jgi:hypothetical protein